MTPGTGPKSGLWLAAFFLLLLGGMITVAIYLFGRDFDRDWRQHVALSLMITTLVVGITAICASANWWLHR